MSAMKAIRRCFDADVAQDRTRQLGEEALDKIEPRPMRRREGEGKAPDRLRGKPARSLARDMGGMVVENDLDRGVGGGGGGGGVGKLNEFTTSGTFPSLPWGRLVWWLWCQLI